MPKKDSGFTKRERNQKKNSSKKGQGYHGQSGRGKRHILANQELAAKRTTSTVENKNYKKSKKYGGNNQKYSAKPNQGMEQKNSAKPISGSQIPFPQKMTEAGAEAVMKALARIKMS